MYASAGGVLVALRGGQRGDAHRASVGYVRITLVDIKIGPCYKVWYVVSVGGAAVMLQPSGLVKQCQGSSSG
jgi:hypothetical protein